MNKTDNLRWSLALGLLLTGGSIYGLLFIDDGFVWRDVYVPIWTDWLLLPLGIIISFLSIRAILRKRKEPPPVVDIDAEAAKAKAELDLMYFKEHGRMPIKSEYEPPEAIIPAHWKRYFTMDAAICLLILGMGLTGVCLDLHYDRDASLQTLVNWALVVAGLVGAFLYHRNILAEKIEPAKTDSLTTNEESAKAELDMMYFKEHGKMPEKPKDE